MRNSKRILAIAVVLIMAFSLLPAFAGSLTQKIEVLLNGVSLYVNNRQVSVENIVYNGVTYVPLRAIGEMLNMKVSWSQKTNRVDLNSDYTFAMKTTDGKYTIKRTNPKELVDGNFFIWQYLTLQFDSPTKGIKSNSDVVLIDYKGNRTNVKCMPGSTDKYAFIIITPNDLELNTNYSLYIPKDSIIMENGDLYKEDVLIYFKTATNALRGKISSEDDLFEKKVMLKSPEGKEYQKNVLMGNMFFFVDIPAGIYEITVNDKVYDNIVIEADKINEINIIEK